tara:strand:- start:1035 stop:1259 length:225 start_codon:yes stop_codon:yes gene_type:complete
MTESEFLDIASGEFLSENYPSEAVLWCRQSRADYCETFKCEDFEYFTGDQIRQNIENMAEQLRAVYLRGLQETR